MMLGGWAVVVGLLAAAWALQMYLAYRQAKAFMAQVRGLRALGRTAIGVSSQSRFKRRAYVALAVDDDERVVGAIKISGLTVWARPRRVDGLVGRSLDELIGEEDGEIALAAAMAARTLRGSTKDAVASDDLPRPLSEAEEVSHSG
jgi:glucitol operon activator protein